jgi:hypothetical protein
MPRHPQHRGPQRAPQLRLPLRHCQRSERCGQRRNSGLSDRRAAPMHVPCAVGLSPVAGGSRVVSRPTRLPCPPVAEACWRSSLRGSRPVEVRMEGETAMRFALSLVIGTVTLALIPLLTASDANAVVCARGVYRAGCAGPSGAAVVRKPAAACRTVIVNGAAVRRCVR